MTTSIGPSEILDSSHQDDEPQHISSSEPSLETQLETLRAEKAKLEGQYGALLGKLTTMRNTLGDKLRQDAVSDRLFFHQFSTPHSLFLTQSYVRLILHNFS